MEMVYDKRKETTKENQVVLQFLIINNAVHNFHLLNCAGSILLFLLSRWYVILINNIIIIEKTNCNKKVKYFS